MIANVASRPRAGTRRAYVGLAMLMVVMAFVGFWPTYFGPLLAGSVATIPFIHFHAAVFVGWLALFAAQAALAARGRYRDHILLGKVGIGYGVLVIVIGVAVAFVMFAARVRAGQLAEAQSRLLAPLLDMVFFAIFFGAAIYWRRTADLHKRLMLVAATSLLIAPVARMPFLGTPPDRTLILSIWLLPIVLGMIYDALRHRTVHWVYPLGAAVLIAQSVWRLGARSSDTWADISAWLATFFV